MNVMWNLWHGCHKYSEGCELCYVYRGDAKRGIDSSVVFKTQSFDLPVRRKKDGSYKIPPGSLVYTCFTSDFLLPDADCWRGEAWDMIRGRPDLSFLFITKRIERFDACKPHDWAGGWDNVTVCVTCENQARADQRLPVLMALPVKHKIFIHEPLLSQIDISPHLDGSVEQVVAGGESGAGARECRFEWVLSIRNQCVDKNVSFVFRQTGANFVKDGVRYPIKRSEQFSQARKAGINYDAKAPQ